jgi:hypothetical protein
MVRIVAPLGAPVHSVPTHTLDWIAGAAFRLDLPLSLRGPVGAAAPLPLGPLLVLVPIGLHSNRLLDRAL